MKKHEPEHHVHAGLHAEPQRPLRPGERVRLRRRASPAAVDGRAGRRPGRARPRRDARDERRGRGPLDARPAGQAGGADRGGQGRQSRQAARGRALQRAPAGAEGRARPTRPRSSRPGSAASRPATRVADVLYGKVNPGGKLPVSFPRNEGQVPIYYNHQPTGRPCDPTNKYNSRHRDILSCAPQYEFGYGLSYTTFKVSNLRLSSTRMDARRGERDGQRRRDEHRLARRRRGRPALHQRPGGEHLAAGAPPARLRARDARSRARRRR